MSFVASAPQPERRHSTVWVVRLVVLIVLILGLVATISTVAVQHSRDRERFDTAHAAYLAGDCEAAVADFDRLLGGTRLFDTAGVENAATTERDECRQILAIDAQSVDDPAGALLAYEAFAVEHPDTLLLDALAAHASDVFIRAGTDEVASESTCDRLDSLQSYGFVPSQSMPAMQVGCAAVYDRAGRPDDAYTSAVAALRSTTDSSLQARAGTIVLANPRACTDLDTTTSLTGLANRPAEHAFFLQQCMDRATAANDLPLLATLQVAYLSQLADDPLAATVEAALIANVAACDQLDAMQADPVVANRAGFLLTITLTCAQTAEFFGDTAAAIERYQWFLDNAPFDPRTATARDGLARSLILRAQQTGAGELPPPTPTGSSGGALTRVVIYNDSPEELRLVVSGPESRIEVIPASPTSGTYSLVGPPSCRTDVPTIELRLTPGDYQVLVEATTGGVRPFTGTWTLGRGDAYESCFFIVVGPM